MSTSKLSLIATLIHILLIVLLMKFDKVLFTHDWENTVLFLIVGVVIIALMLAIASRKTRLGAVLMVANGIYMVICLFMLLFALTYTFKV